MVVFKNKVKEHADNVVFGGEGGEEVLVFIE